MSPWRVVRNDAIARAGAMLTTAIVVVHVLVVWVARLPDVPMATPAVAALAGLLLVGWRLRHHGELFRRGVRTEGVVVDARFRRGNGRVWFDHGQIRTWAALADTPDVRRLRPGEPVELLVLPDRPAIACPRAVFAYPSDDQRRTTRPPGNAST